MKKLSLTAIGFYLGILAAFSQNTGDTSYKSKKLSLEEVNFVSGYYSQNGNNSAVTGGIGTEKLTDFANTIDLKFTKYSKPFLKHTLNVGVGVDHYTSASSDKIDPNTISSPSYSDTRFYPSAGWTVHNEKKNTSFGFTGSYSTEFDYQSIGLGASFVKGSKDNNTEFGAKLQAYFDQWSVIYPIELRSSIPGGSEHSGISGHSPRNSFSGAFSFAQVVNQSLQFSIVAEPVYQNGLLATKYQRVYFTNGNVRSENLPDTRFKLPLGFRANLFLADKFVIRTFYRYYQDNWGLKAHTVEVETPIKLSPFFSLSPFFRFYTQNGVDYFAPYGQHNTSETYFTSDYDLSKFTSNYLGANFRMVPENGVLGIQKLHSLELRYGHYNRSNGLNSNQVTLHLQFK